MARQLLVLAVFDRYLTVDSQLGMHEPVLLIRRLDLGFLDGSRR